MNRRSDPDRLLADTLADTAPAGFREALLGETLRLARRRRRWRQTRRGVIALAALGLLAVSIRQIVPRHPSVLPVTVAGWKTVHSQPLPPGAMVGTKPFSPDRFTTSVAGVEVIQTAAAASEYREIGDNELLALVASRPAVLVGCGPQCKQLIFVNPEDAKGFPVN